MLKTEPLRFNYEFSRVYRRGRGLSDKHVSLHVFERDRYVRRGLRVVDSQINRLGVTANRKVRTAVLRNRIRRLQREAYRQLEHELKPGFDLIFMIKQAEDIPSFSQIVKEMDSLLKRAGVKCVASKGDSSND